METAASKLSEGIGSNPDVIPALPADLVGEYEYPGIDVTMAIRKGSTTWAHASDVCVSIMVKNDNFNGVEFKGSFEQLRYLCNSWLKQLDEMEKEARS